MQLNNPKRDRVLAEIIANLADHAKAEVAARLARVNRLIEQQQKFDAQVEAALARIQKAKQLRKRVRSKARA